MARGAGIVRVVSRHLEPVSDLPDEGPWSIDDAHQLPITHPAWWRWVAVVLVLALVVATPFAYALYRLLD